jgi:hypothetical protein
MNVGYRRKSECARSREGKVADMAHLRQQGPDTKKLRVSHSSAATATLTRSFYIEDSSLIFRLQSKPQLLINANKHPHRTGRAIAMMFLLVDLIARVPSLLSLSRQKNDCKGNVQSASFYKDTCR